MKKVLSWWDRSVFLDDARFHFKWFAGLSLLIAMCVSVLLFVPGNNSQGKGDGEALMGCILAILALSYGAVYNLTQALCDWSEAAAHALAEKPSVVHMGGGNPWIGLRRYWALGAIFLGTVAASLFFLTGFVWGIAAGMAIALAGTALLFLGYYRQIWQDLVAWTKGILSSGNQGPSAAGLLLGGAWDQVAPS